MVHEIYKVVSMDVVGDYTLRIAFDDGMERIINFRPVLAGELYRPLLDLAVFNQVKIDPETFTLVWPNGADFDPATLHIRLSGGTIVQTEFGQVRKRVMALVRCKKQRRTLQKEGLTDCWSYLFTRRGCFFS